MRVKRTTLVSIIVLTGLLAFCFSSQAVPASSSEKDMDQTIRNLQTRISTLEAKISNLQRQLQNMENKSSRVLTIPDPKGFQGDSMPPGSKQHKIGNILYWTVPLGAAK